MTYSQYLQCVEYAKQHHAGQKRKYTGEPYINHLIAVSETLKEESFCERASAIFHDILEDTPVTPQDLTKFLISLETPSLSVASIMSTVIELTDFYTKESFPDLNRKSRKELESYRLGWISLEAQEIKCADILDNLRSISIYDHGFYLLTLKEISFIYSYKDTYYRQCLMGFIKK